MTFPSDPTAGRLGRIALMLAAAAVLGAACASADPPLGIEAQDAVAAISDEVPTPEPTPAGAVDAAQSTPETRAAVDEAIAAFLTQQSSTNAEALNTAMAQDGDRRWMPWLVDLLRLGLSTRVNPEIQATLTDLSGVASTGNRIPDLSLYGGWVRTNALDGGDGYREWKTTLYGRIDDEFGPLINSVVEQEEIAAIQWGGVPRGGIPELNFAERVTGADADWMEADEVILGVAIDGEAVAFPLRILARHELANDTVGGTPVSVVYCTLCRSGLLFDRRVEGQLLEFETSGLLLDSNKIMVDRETDTLWHHLRGLGIGGEFEGVQLTQLPLDTVRWSDWLAANPDTDVLALPAPIFFDDPERPPISYDYTPGEAYRSYYEDPDLWFPILDTPETYPLKNEVIGITNAGDAYAISLDEVVAESPVTVEVGGEAFTIESTGPGARVLNAAGERVIVEQSFWFAWYANHRDTRTHASG